MSQEKEAREFYKGLKLRDLSNGIFFAKLSFFYKKI